MEREQPYGKDLDWGKGLIPEHPVVDAGLGLFGGLRYNAGARGAGAGADGFSITSPNPVNPANSVDSPNPINSAYPISSTNFAVV